MAGYQKESVFFPSADGKTRVAGYFYAPETPKAIIQISHGMCEYVERYEPMIGVLCAAGYAVCGNDHLGHGSTGDPKDWGFFAEKDGSELVLQDLHTMNALAREKWPGLPLILLGHSMGSFFGRWFAEKYPDALDALVISGTGGPGALMKIGKAMAGFFTRVKGPRYVSQFMVKASMGSYSKGIEDDRSKNVWLSRDPAVWEAYDKDPKCTFPFTVSAFRDMLTVHVHVNTPEWAGNLRKDLPVYVYSGDMDPVGEYGKGVRAVEQLLRDAKLQDVTMRLYPQGRHEMHNELNKDEVFRDLIAWCDAHI